jgi:hypothetical protein
MEDPIFPHRVTYISNEEGLNIIQKIRNQIDLKQYDLITFSQFVLIKRNGCHILLSEEVREMLLQTKPYTHEIDKTIFRIFAHRQYLEESIQYINLSRIFYDIDNENILINNSKHSLPIFILYMRKYINEIEKKSKYDDAIELLKKGANINIQDDNGDTFLHYFINHFSYLHVYEETKRTYLDFLEFLLNNGSDPLLPNKKGQSCFFINKKIKNETVWQKPLNTIKLCDLFDPLLVKY